ncbi:putative RNA exonuclease pqe-1 [Wyeomyia smithii]|uniref:putative RNA exonuclease pqe-1 n=1 Tax=Wyeomyia smithii TaxID=174621 RepID=UPI002467E564|nr:putative RNA exonuclease pqe-1 [Wyeomyia smithii]XP_055545753.1 putative RNA exonuclease pqe-1 [Wyeomyia smithii]
MNAIQMPEAQLQRYELDKRAWEDAIRGYTGPDPLDIWFNFICWLEQHKMFDKDGGFRKILEQCLSNFENYENYKQDVRMVKLWMKFIDMQANPLNLYQFLYKKNVGTQCACFYIGWAHYYDAANAFKQAESIYNLGIQVKAQPMEELQEAQNKFRLSIAQRMLYNDASSKKRSANTLVEQRQQITSLSPPQKKLKAENIDYYQSSQQHTQPPVQQLTQPPVQQPAQVQVSQAPQSQLQSQHSQHQQQPNSQLQQPHYAGYYQQQQQSELPAVSASNSTSSTMTAEQYYQQDKQNASYYQNNNSLIYQNQHHQTVSSQTQIQSPITTQPSTQRQMQSVQVHHNVQHQLPYQPLTSAHPHPSQEPHSASQQLRPQTSCSARFQSQVIVQAPPAVNQTAAPVQSKTALPQQHISVLAPTQPPPPQIEQPVHKSVIIENYSLTNDSLIECNLNNSAYVISSSLNYVYDDADLTGYSIEEPTVEKVDLNPTGIRLPINFSREARSNHERWEVPLCLEEPYDLNRKCCYPKGVVYPDLHTGKPTMEFSLEEIRARKWYRRKEELEEQTKAKQQQLEFEKQRQERQRQLQLQYQQQQHHHQHSHLQQQPQQPQPQQQPQHHQSIPQQANYGHPQQQITTPTTAHRYQQPNQYPHVLYQQQSPNQPVQQYQPPSRQSQEVAAPIQAAALTPTPYYHQHLQQHQPIHHQSGQHNPQPTIQSVQHSPIQPAQHAPIQVNYANYRHPYPQQQNQYQPPSVPVHQQSPVQQPAAYQQHSPYHSNHYAGYPAPNYTHSQPPVHQSPPMQMQSPHQYPIQQNAQQVHHNTHQSYTSQPPVRTKAPSQPQVPIVPAKPNSPIRQTPNPPPPQPYIDHPATSQAPVASQPAQQYTSQQKSASLSSKPQAPVPQNQPIRKPTASASLSQCVPPATKSSISNCDDFEEQIEASTIRFSTSTENGTSKSKTITIKFKKDKSAVAAPSPINTPPAAVSQPTKHRIEATATSSAAKIETKKSRKVSSIDGTALNNTVKDNSKNEVKTKPSKAKLLKSKYDSETTLIPARPIDDSLSDDNETSDRSYASSPGITPSKSKSKSKARYVIDDDDDDEFDEREFPDSDEDDYGEVDDDDEDDLDEDGEEEEEEENDSSYQSNSEFNTSFSNISFAGDNSNGAFNFGGGSSCSTPLRHTQTSSGISKTSTPVGSFRFLKKHESNFSLLGQNDDSMNSTVVENSYFQTEHDEEGRRRRKEKALDIIDTHLAKPFLDPFSSELCKAFLTKIDFPSRENSSGYKVVNSNLPKLMKSQMACLGGTTYSIEKEVGRGSYGSVFRAVNNQNGAVVAIKYQKPANTWELYICTEVKKRINNPEILPGFMDICSAVIAPNASVLVSEFSQYGSLLDINNKIRTATTKVMHESLVMHFSSQILAIVEHLHACNIIHADIKPDNFLLMQIPTVESDIPTLRLIDFGCAIDMNFFEKNRQFKKVIQTDGFTCIEMQEGRPWSFQTDLFCVAGTIHVMLFGEYMQLTKKFDWEIKQKLPRYLKKHVWSEVFQKLLNIKDINHMPKLSALKELIDGEAFNLESELVKHIRTLSNLLKRR